VNLSTFPHIGAAEGRTAKPELRELVAVHFFP
jgi:hypothetical protein